jgi:hypothetical protein
MPIPDEVVGMLSGDLRRFFLESMKYSWNRLEEALWLGRLLWRALRTFPYHLAAPTSAAANTRQQNCTGRINLICN